MNLTAIIRKSADYVLRSYLDVPFTPSLEMLPAIGEREQVKIEDRNCFVYVLLSSDGKRYAGSYSTGSGFSIPALPKKVGILIPTFRHQVRAVVRPEPELRDFKSIDRALQEVWSESGIIECREGVYGIFGITEPELRHLLYVPAETMAEADGKINAYQEKVNMIFQPHRLSCPLKIKPLLKPGNLKGKPSSLRESYFGHGC